MKKTNRKAGQTAEQQVDETKQADTDKLTVEKPGSEASNLLTLTDMEKLLTSMEERIIAKLSAQLSAERAIIDQHHETIQQLETSHNDMHTQIERLESSCAALSKDNEELKVKLDDLENRSRRNNIRIIGLPEKVERLHLTSFIDTLRRLFLPQRSLTGLIGSAWSGRAQRTPDHVPSSCEFTTSRPRSASWI